MVPATTKKSSVCLCVEFGNKNTTEYGQNEIYTVVLLYTALHLYVLLTELDLYNNSNPTKASKNIETHTSAAFRRG